MGRRRKPASRLRKWLWRLFGLMLLMAISAAGWFWWEMQHWTPDEASYPDQGLLIEAADGPVNFRTAKALGARFVYLRASDGAGGGDPALAGNLADASAANLQIGMVHHFDPCETAGPQSANFVTMVPRNADLLPAVIELDATGMSCMDRVSDAGIESELITLINQIENHTGKPIILKVAPEFEEAYGFGARLERGLWLTRTRFQPDYVGRPWLVWTANEHFRSEISEGPLDWLVVRP